ncbi:hypothetical protein [Streptosporangium sp. H16]|uniref:hypothetical protein n=1 Tax=Streptosporangium sp. H16 TaxID=3444184 RepID=UPI003F78E6E4
MRGADRERRLALSLSRRSSELAAAGRHEEALAASEEPLEIARTASLHAGDTERANRLAALMERSGSSRV